MKLNIRKYFRIIICFLLLLPFSAHSAPDAKAQFEHAKQVLNSLDYPSLASGEHTFDEPWQFSTYTKAIETLHKLEEEGNNQAKRYLKSRQKDINMKQKAEQGDAEAQYELAQKYRSRSPKNHKYWLIKSERSGNYKAYCVLSTMSDASTTQSTNNSAFATAEASDGFVCKINNVLPWYKDARNDATFHQLDTFTRFYTKAKENRKDPQPAFLIARMYSRGDTVKQDYEKAAKWYKKAADLGHYEADSSLDILYAEGYAKAPYNYVPNIPTRDLHNAAVNFYQNGEDKKAMNYMEKAAKRGYALSQYSLGLMYLQGRGSAKNYELGRKWLDLAAEQGNEDAKSLIIEVFGG